ncbi:hypothetical protein JZ751_003739 [Albula glossodonta]|uniref:Uncharacterized protein n=1 Tax=Albula glossodonta TaxID=121402 RepID=A0A8T2P594_9TELE|nr:hypothetical protein JZ751_003739 [Albula glossodonta]
MHSVDLLQLKGGFLPLPLPGLTVAIMHAVCQRHGEQCGAAAANCGCCVAARVQPALASALGGSGLHSCSAPCSRLALSPSLAPPALGLTLRLGEGGGGGGAQTEHSGKTIRARGWERTCEPVRGGASAAVSSLHHLCSAPRALPMSAQNARRIFTVSSVKQKNMRSLEPTDYSDKKAY